MGAGGEEVQVGVLGGWTDVWVSWVAGGPGRVGVGGFEGVGLMS